jgi:SAM-dependent methyltransferase
MVVLSKYAAVARKFGWSVRRRGVVGTLRIALGRLRPESGPRALAKRSTHPFDLRFGVETSGLIDGTELLSGHRHDAFNTAYWGVSPSRARELLRLWRESVTGRGVEEYAFVDVGCGKGRMLLIASEMEFREVVGVELHAGLAATSAANAAKWSAEGRSRCAIRVVQGDATEMALPEGRCMVFLYNPFGAPVLRSLLGRLEEQYAGRPGELDVLYLSPECDAVFAERGGFELLWRAELAQTDAEEGEDVIAGGRQPCSAYRLR